MLYVREELWSSSGLLMVCDMCGGNSGGDRRRTYLLCGLPVVAYIWPIVWSGGVMMVICVICLAGTAVMRVCHLDYVGKNSSDYSYV